MAPFDPLANQSKLPKIEIERYLKRIDCKPERVPSIRYLKALHKAHIMCVPFENLDIHLGNQIILDVHKIFQKVIANKRGGFCFELNGLFYHLLSQLGFTCHLISAQVFNEGEPGMPFEHAAILVYFDEKVYLVDVGFGDLFLEPKMLNTSMVQMDFTKYFKFEKTIDDEYILKVSDNSFDYEPKYLFTTKKREFIEFIDMCDYHQSNENSHFRKKKLITKATPNGRVTLTNSKLTITEAGKKEEYDIMNMDEFRVKLREHFGI